MHRATLRQVALVLIASGTVGVAVAQASECHQVRGHLEETPVPITAGCGSPVGICTVSQMFGALHGEGHFTASQLIPSATPDVFFVTGDTVILDAKVVGHRGTLTVQDAAAFRVDRECQRELCPPHRREFRVRRLRMPSVEAGHRDEGERKEKVL